MGQPDEEAQIGTIVVAGETFTIALQAYAASLGPTSGCQLFGTAVLAS